MATTRFAHHLLTGDHASRPAAADVPEGTLYSCTDHDLVYQSDTVTWTTWATLGATISDILDLPTAEMDDTLVLAPDGGGGVEFRAETGGGGGGSCVWLQRQTASTSAQLDFTGFISSTYETYEFVFQDIFPDTDNVDFRVRFGTGGGPTYDTGSNYIYGLGRNEGGAIGAGGAQTTACNLQSQIDTTYPDWLTNGFFKLHKPSSAKYKYYTGVLSSINGASSNSCGGWIWGQFMTNSALTAIRFFMSSGNIATGTIDVYGYTHA